jgi:hypothetical protein
MVADFWTIVGVVAVALVVDYCQLWFPWEKK